MTNEAFFANVYLRVLYYKYYTFFMEKYLNIGQIVTAVLLIVAILFQSRGTGLSSVFGGEGNVYRTKRGFEKGLFIATIVLSILFLGIALANILIRG